MSNHSFCIIVGHNDPPFSNTIEDFEPLKEIMGNYRWATSQSICSHGKRITYTDLLNHTIESVTGKPGHFHVADTPHLGAYYLASYLRKRSINAEIVNFFNYDKEQFKRLLARSPLAVAITTTYHLSITPIIEIVQFIKAYNPDVPIIVGGPRIVHTCLDFPEKGQDSLLAQMGANIYINENQGELTLSRVCIELAKENPSLERIPNLLYTRDGETFQRTRREIEDNNMNENSLDWSLFPTQDLQPMVSIRTARSCAFKCAFCRYPILGGPFNLLELDRVNSELNYLHSIGVNHFMVIDDTFNVPGKRFKTFCQSLINSNYNFTWFCYFRCANVDRETVELAAKSGCKGVFLGIESGDQEVLKAMNKAAAVDGYQKGIRLLKEYDIITHASIIIGHPGETEQTARNTIEFLMDTQPDYYAMQLYFHDPKAPIALKTDQYRIEGKHYAWKHKSMDWQEASDIIDAAIETITESAVLPVLSYNVESLVYLMARGLSPNTIKSFTGIASEMLVKSLKNPNPDFSAQEQKLKNLFQAEKAIYNI
jgi:p-methyltransferase